MTREFDWRFNAWYTTDRTGPHHHHHYEYTKERGYGEEDAHQLDRNQELDYHFNDCSEETMRNIIPLMKGALTMERYYDCWRNQRDRAGQRYALRTLFPMLYEEFDEARTIEWLVGNEWWPRPWKDGRR
jgi:hypothetical protein